MRLLGDIGGTNARFALAGGDGVPRHERKLPVAHYAGLIEAVEDYLSNHPPVEEAVLAVATPVRGDEVAFTNNPWRFSIRQVRETLGLRRLEVMNDLIAHAVSVSALRPDELGLLKPGESRPGRPCVVIGPGTGLGVAFLMPYGNSLRPIPSEAGHASFAPDDDVQVEILNRIRGQWGHVSVERLVSGPGLLSIALALAELGGQDIDLQSPRDVSSRAMDSRCPVCVEAVRIFSTILGSTAGNLALTVLAEGGVFVTGGLSRNIRPVLDLPALAKGFTSKGRLSDYLADIPIRQILRPHSALLGAAIYRGAE